MHVPFRFPPAPPPEVTLRPLPSPATGLSRLPVGHLPCVPVAQLPRRTVNEVHSSSYSPVPRGLPLIFRRVGGPHLHFRGLLRLHSRSARKVAQPPKAAFVTGLSVTAGYHDKTTPVSCQILNRQLSGWILRSHWCYRRRRGTLRSPGLSSYQRVMAVSRPASATVLGQAERREVSIAGPAMASPNDRIESRGSKGSGSVRSDGVGRRDRLLPGHRSATGMRCDCIPRDSQ